MCLLLSFSLLAQAPAGWVVIPLKDYDALRAKVSPIEPASEPVDATVSRLEYDLRIVDNQAIGRAQVTVDVLRDTWVRVPLPAGLLVREARLPAAGKAATLVDGGALFSRKGRYLLELDLVLPVTTSGGEEKLVLPAGKSGITRAAVQLGRPGLEVKTTGGLLAGDTGGRWLAHGRGQEPLVLSWRRKLEENREELPLRQRGTLVQWVGLGEDATSVWAEVTVDVVQGTARRVKLQVPAGLTVNQVPGANVAEWDVKADELDVAFLEPVDKQTRFLVQAEARLPRDGSLAVPLLRLTGMERETGGLAVEVLGAAEIRQRTPQGLEPATAAELGAFASPRQSGSVEAFRYRPGSPARSLQVEVARYTPQAVLTANVEEARIHSLVGADGKVLIRARYAVRNNQRNFLKLTLPAGAVLWNASLSGRTVQPGRDTSGNLIFPLAKTAGEEAPAFALEVAYLLKSTAWAAAGKAALRLPVLDLPVSRTGLVLFYDPRYRLTVAPGSFRLAEFQQPDSPAFQEAAAAASPPPALINAITPPASAAMQNSQILVDRFRARREVLATPVSSPASFPAFGPSLFLTAELTAEGREPQVELAFEKARGVK